MNRVVVKIGGSLIDAAEGVLNELLASGVSALVVPGGGIFADSVRAADLDDDSAHWQAISSMNRYGRYLSTFGFPVTEHLSMPESCVSILLPEKVLREADPLPHSWDVTSDSLALWMAGELGVPLLLVKSRDGDASDLELVDAYFSNLSASLDVPVYFANGRSCGSVTRVLEADEATLL
ncbi:MAG TPA: uridylate kinase [Methanocorpusculum sp.]|nr:uridylate kinase [Methanocorpusculum sp.]MBQ4597461.1 uridylate kinase [Methanocorpusculum sp.]HJJ64655.1 uridylate kinase [Methanocorpusculum sp.]HJJ76072.1 uridylate kinase [Methanocorpusculum sp.]